MTKNQNLLMGAAMAAGLLGTLTTLLLPRKGPKGWAEQAKEVANRVVMKKKEANKNLLLGGVAGGIVGVTTALLLAPKSGSELLKDMYKPFAPLKRATSQAKKAVRRATPKHAVHHEHATINHHKKATKVKRASTATPKKNSKRAQASKHQADLIEGAKS